MTPAASAVYIAAVRLARAPMAELVDASDSKSDSARSAGSIPARGTTFFPRRIRSHPPCPRITKAFRMACVLKRPV